MRVEGGREEMTSGALFLTTALLPDHPPPAPARLRVAANLRGYPTRISPWPSMTTMVDCSANRPVWRVDVARMQRDSLSGVEALSWPQRKKETPVTRESFVIAISSHLFGLLIGWILGTQQ